MSSPVRARDWEQKLTIKCRFCGGPQCKRCSEHAALAKTDSPIPGLHADWITDRILGMMRPSSRLIKQYQITDQFHRHHITAVFNLTIPGEHPFCGDGLGSSGFPYDPENDFMAQKIQFYNFGWEDMTVPPLSLMMDIVKVMTSMLQDGMQKVAVHCHAGYGRTGLAIACVLLFMHGISPERAIHIVRRDRPGSIQTSGQATFVHEFCEYMNSAKVTFALPFIHEPFTIAQAIEQQNRLMHGTHTGQRSFQISRILNFLCSKLEQFSEKASFEVIQALIAHPPRAQVPLRYLANSRKQDSGSFGRRHSSPQDTLGASASQSTSILDELFSIKVAFNQGPHAWHSLQQSMSSENAITIFSALLLDWLEHLSKPLLDACMISSTSQNVYLQMNGLPMSVALAIDRILTLLRFLLRNQPDSKLSENLYRRIGMAVFHLRQIADNSMGDSTLIQEASILIQSLSREWKLREPLPLNMDLIHRLNTDDPQKLSPLSSPRKPSESRSLPQSTNIRAPVEDLLRRQSAALADAPTGTCMSPVKVNLDPLPSYMSNKSIRSQRSD